MACESIGRRKPLLNGGVLYEINDYKITLGTSLSIMSPLGEPSTLPQVPVKRK